VDTKLDTKTTTATTASSLSEVPLLVSDVKRTSLSSAYFPSPGNSNPDSFSTCRRNTEGFTRRLAQMSKVLLSDGLVFPSSMRLMKARS
jgi:hypothetical protein